MAYSAIILVTVGAILGGAIARWEAVPIALAFLYLGTTLQFLAIGSSEYAVAGFLVGVGVEAVLLATDPGLAAAQVSRGRRWSRAGAASWLTTGFRFRWFDSSVTAVALVGALGIASARPLLGSVGLDASADVLVCAGVLFCLLGRLPRIACGLLFLLAAGGVWLAASTLSVAGLELCVLASLQLALAVAVARLELSDEQRPFPASAPVGPSADTVGPHQPAGEADDGGRIS